MEVQLVAVALSLACIPLLAELDAAAVDVATLALEAAALACPSGGLPAVLMGPISLL